MNTPQKKFCKEIIADKSYSINWINDKTKKISITKNRLNVEINFEKNKVIGFIETNIYSVEKEYVMPVSKKELKSIFEDLQIIEQTCATNVHTEIENTAELEEVSSEDSEDSEASEEEDEEEEEEEED